MRRWGVELAWVAATAALYVVLAELASAFAVLGTLSVWYAPAGLAIALGTLRGWWALPGLALGELVVSLVVFDVTADFGWLVVPNAIAYAAVYTGAGRVVAAVGGAAPSVAWRRPTAIIVMGAVGAPLAGAVVGVAFQVAAGLVVAGDVPEQLLVWALGDAVGTASIGPAVVTSVVRWRRGGRWWAIPGLGGVPSTLAVLAPGALLLLLGSVFDGIVPFAAAVLVPFMALAVFGGVSAVALAALPTTAAMTTVARDTFSSDLLALTDLQLVQLLVIAVGGFVGLVVEERRELAEQVDAQAAQLRSAELQAGAGAFSLDVHDGVVWWSPGMRRLVGIGADDPIGVRSYLKHIHPDDVDEVVERLTAATDHGERYEATHRLVRPDGEVRVLRAVVAPREFDGRVIELVGTLTDITAEAAVVERLEVAVIRERAAAEAERAARLAEISAATAAERTERIKEALLVAVSHEVRTPLTVVRGIAETLARQEIAQDRIADHAPMLDRLQRHTGRLATVLGDLLDVDRIARGVIEPVRRPTDVRRLLEEVVTSMSADTERVAVRVVDGLDDHPIDVRFVSRIVEHLVANALRHAVDGPIEVSAERDAGGLLLHVADRGPGIAAADRERVFEPFEQVEVDAARPGTGVGLYLVARFAELHGGRAWVTDRRAGRGAVVHVLLPPATAVATADE